MPLLQPPIPASPQLVLTRTAMMNELLLRRPLPLLLPPPPKRISQPPTHNLRNTQPQRRPPHQAPRPKLRPKRLFPPHRQQQVQARPGSGDARGVDAEAVDVHPAGEEEDGREEHGERLEGLEVLRCGEGCEKGWWDGGFYRCHLVRLVL